MAWVLLVNLSTFLTWVLLVNLTKNAQNFRRFAPNRAGVFIFIENLQNFGRGFLIEGGFFIFNTPVEFKIKFLKLEFRIKFEQKV